jgi:hypothetical protein
MATYVNDLRLKEIATGDESGTWGTSTNTNLELIAEAFGFGTEDFASDADDTLTIADGATDPARSLYLKIGTTTTLTATRNLTLAPNTVSKVWIIENATAGGQSITVKQGSGTSVTIANGDVAVVYSDGGGAGANVVNAFTDLQLAGTANVAGQLTAGGLAYPTSDGTSDQVLTTDGSGTLSFSTITGTTINDNADNRVITGSGTANTLNGESTLIYDGSNFGIGVTPTHNFNQQASGLVEARFRSTDNDCLLQISSDTDEGQDSKLEFLSGTSARGSIVYDHNTTAGSQQMQFKVGDNAQTPLRISGDAKIDITSDVSGDKAAFMDAGTLPAAGTYSSPTTSDGAGGLLTISMVSDNFAPNDPLAGGTQAINTYQYIPHRTGAYNSVIGNIGSTTRGSQHGTITFTGTNYTITNNSNNAPLYYRIRHMTG